LGKGRPKLFASAVIFEKQPTNRRKFAQFGHPGSHDFNTNQCCQKVYFQPKKFNLGKFFKVLQSTILVNFMEISYILLPFGIFHGHLVYFEVILVYFCSFGMLYQEQSGNPDTNHKRNSSTNR
jgi:hypothetical protein